MLKETPSLAVLPVFVRAGAIVPHQPLVQSLSQPPQGPLEMDVYPGPDCQGELYDDDILLWSERQGDLLRRIAAGGPVNERPDWVNIIVLIMLYQIQ